jgi:autotransporter-associated beta strand protein
VATSSRITVSGATLTIDPTSPLAGLTGYYVLIDATAVKNIAGFFFVGISDSATWNFTTATDDTTAPTIASLNPADDASGVAVNVTLTATFSEIIQKGTGNITLKKSADNSTVETFDVATSSRITVSGATLTIAPTSLLGAATGYYVEIAAGAIKDLVDNAFAGISGNAAWNFTTATPRQLTWDANGTGAGLTDGTGNWLDANQWWDGAANTAWTYNDSATIGSGGSGGIITLASPTAAGRVTFTNFTDSYTLTGGSLLVNSNLTVASGNVSISTPVGGSGGITKTGEGTLTLSGANTYSGGTLINGGTLLLGSDNPLGIGTTTVTNGATLDLGTRWNTRAITLNGGTLANTPSPSVVHGDGGNVTIIFSGNGTLTSASNNSWIHVRSTTGSGTMVINASSSGVYNAQGTTWANTGGVVLQNGGISLYAGRTITGGPVTINNGTFSTLGINQIGTLLPVTVNGGTWELSGAQTIGSLAGTGGTVNLSTNTLATGGNNADTTYAGAITGTNGALVKTGSGTLTLSGASTYAGATTVSNGTLAFVTGGSCSNSAVTVADNAALGVVVTNSATQWKCSSLIFSSGTGSKLKYVFDVTPSTGLTGLAPLRINNNLTFTGTPTVDVNPTNLVTGMKYPLVDVGGSAPTSTVPTLTGVGGSLSWVGNTLYLIMPPRGTFISFF